MIISTRHLVVVLQGSDKHEQSALMPSIGAFIDQANVDASWYNCPETGVYG
jgi:hypothetical protein